MLLCSSGQLHLSVQIKPAFDDMALALSSTEQGRLSVSAQGSLSFQPDPADVTVGAPPLAPSHIPRAKHRRTATTIQAVGGWAGLKPWLGGFRRELHSNCKMRSWH